jgi:hypothetical protein
MKAHKGLGGRAPGVLDRGTGWAFVAHLMTYFILHDAKKMVFIVKNFRD